MNDCDDDPSATRVAERMPIRDETLLDAIAKTRQEGAACLQALDEHAEQLGAVLQQLHASAAILRARAESISAAMIETVEEREALADQLSELEAMAQRIAAKRAMAHGLYERSMTTLFEELTEGGDT